MKKRSRKQHFSEGGSSTPLRERLIGLGERSFRKNYFPELQERLDDLERFRALLDHSSDIILLAHLPSRHIIDANASACRQLGYLAEELLATDIGKIIDLESLIWPEKSREAHEGATLSATLQRGDGVKIPAELTFSMDAFAGCDYVIFVARDITERLRTERNLQQSEARFRAIYRSAAAGMAIIDARGRFLQVNPAICRLLGYSEPELLQRTVEQITHPDDREGTRRFYRDLSPGDERTYEKRFLRADGTPVWGQVAAAWLYGADLHSMQVITLVQDITERKRAEEVLRESDRIKSEFIAIAAHELRNPLTAIMGFSQLLVDQTELNAAEKTELLTYIHEKSIILAQLMDDLLDIARIEAGRKMALKRTQCPASELIASVALRIQKKETRHRIEVELEGQGSILLVDRLKVGQVLENLLSNALKYSPRGGRIRISGHPRSSCYEFSIQDEGIGMTPDQVERIFDKFYRADAANSEIKGIGLGMNIVRNIIEAHGGEIHVESAPGRGTTVRFTLPLSEKAGVPDAPE